MKRGFARCMVGAFILIAPWVLYAVEPDIEVLGDAVENEVDGSWTYNYWLHNANPELTRNVFDFSLMPVGGVYYVYAPMDWVGVYYPDMQTVEFSSLIGPVPVPPNDNIFGFFYSSTLAPTEIGYLIHAEEGIWEGWVVGSETETVIALGEFTAQNCPSGISLRWEMLEEYGIVGYKLYRDNQPLLDSFIPAANESGAVYFYTDETVAHAEYTLTRLLPSGEENILGTAIYEGGPLAFTLSQNYPNPFNPTTQISYSVARTSDVELSVYNVIGEEVATLVEGEVAPGTHTVNFDAHGLQSGVYFYRLRVGEQWLTRKMTLIQ